MSSDIRTYLGSRSVPAEHIHEAEAGGWLPLLVADQVLFPSGRRYTAGELAEAAHVDPEVAKVLWRAMGFTEVGDDEPVYFQEDLEALSAAADELATGAPLGDTIRHTRTMNAAVSRVAEAIADEFVAGLRTLKEAGGTDEDAAGFLQNMHPEAIERFLGYFFRRHFRAALWRKLAVPAELLGHPQLTVGFVDLVRFTAITEEIPEDELDALIVRFGEVAHDRITAGGGRMVKMIGDEVMFVADDVTSGTAIALDLVEAYAVDQQLPPARAGVACGEILSRDGDYFGPVVNLASRIVDVARPNSVIVSEAVHEALSGAEGLSWHRLPPKRLKGIGIVRLWSPRRR
jgi:adenylate cyclase